MFWFFKKKKATNNSNNKIRVSNPFDFNKYPKLFFEYLNYAKIIKIIYKIIIQYKNPIFKRKIQNVL